MSYDEHRLNNNNNSFCCVFGAKKGKHLHCLQRVLKKNLDTPDLPSAKSNLPSCNTDKRGEKAVAVVYLSPSTHCGGNVRLVITPACLHSVMVWAFTTVSSIIKGTPSRFCACVYFSSVMANNEVFCRVMHCREVCNRVLARSCSIYRCRELEKMGTFFQVCVGAPLADDHAHNRERVPLIILFMIVIDVVPESNHKFKQFIMPISRSFPKTVISTCTKPRP